MSEPSNIRVSTIEQLRALKAMQLIDRFTLAKLAAIAGISARTLGSQLSHWKKEGVLLLEQVGVAPNGRPGQPKKIFRLAADMVPIVRASVVAAEGSLAQPPTDKIVPLDRMALVDAAGRLAAAAEKEFDSGRRGRLVAEAARLLEQTRIVLQRRLEAGRGGVSGALQNELARIEHQVIRAAAIKSQSPEEERLRIMLEASAADLQRVPREHRDLLTRAAKYHVEVDAVGQPAELCFFGGLMAARGQQGNGQDTVIDGWIFDAASHYSGKSELDRGPSWDDIETRLIESFGKIIERGYTAAVWHPVVAQCLAGVAKNAVLSVLSGFHVRVADLFLRTSSPVLRRQALIFLQQYAGDVELVAKCTDIFLPEAQPDGDEDFIDPYFRLHADKAPISPPSFQRVFGALRSEG
ncbi:hypothetical protein [Bradyrhizobium sp. 1]|uniref:hypothetical protein n=1 Tax=Bradyrhizobium sp. 1 TaxID=241591 RepID=UPI001FF85C36|nr:hypothetical protein [Bradyrhizobium sp. 1]MCK1391477.1 hypothetical protein [Bradyrhizobium sp. 1]